MANPLQYSCLENFMGRGAWRASLWGRKELGTIEQLTHIHTHKNSSSIIPHIYVKKYS